MSISEIIKQTRSQYKVADFSPITEENFEDIRKAIADVNSYDEYLEKLKKYDLDKNKVYMSTKDIHVFDKIMYIDEPFFISLNLLWDSYMGIIGKSLCIKQGKENLEKWLAEKNFKKFYLYLNEKFQIDYFNRNYSQIDNLDLRKEILSDIYVSTDYALDLLDRDLISTIFKKGEYVNVLKDVADSKGYVTIYRGMTEKSTPIKQAFSYSLDFDRAAWFASRFNSNDMKIYEGKIHIEDVLSYEKSRNEEEIIAAYEDVLELKELDIMNYKDVETYTYEINKYIHGEFYYLLNINDKKEPHGYLHSKRMLFYMIALGDKIINLEQDFNILGVACTLHDIGRINDGKCLEHGHLSLKYIEENDILKTYLEDYFNSEEELHICKEIILNHCKDDSVGIASINDNIHISSKEWAIDLYRIFKDLDALDRVRFGCVNANYFRNPETRLILPLAYQSCKYIK